MPALSFGLAPKLTITDHDEWSTAGDRVMNEGNQRSAGQITPMETAAIRKVGEEHAGPTLAGHPNASALEGTAVSIEIQGQTQGPGSKSLGVDQIGIILPKVAPAHEIGAPNRREVVVQVAPRGGRGRSVGLVTGALMAALGLGWIGGSNSYRLLDLNPVWTQLQQKASSSIRALTSGFESVWNETVGSIDGTAHGKMAGQDVTSETPNTREVPTRAARDLGGGTLVDGRESSQGAARDLTIRVEQVREATERSQREIAAGLVRLGERLDRVEHQLANVSATKTAPSTAQQNTSSARPAVPVQRLAPGAAAKISLGPPSTESNADRRQNAIEGWTIQGIYSGTAVLAGPDGIRRVSPGDTVPGVGRVDSIVRRGSRWVVITSGGMITAD